MLAVAHTRYFNDLLDTGIYFDDVNDHFGIGTTSPLYALHVIDPDAAIMVANNETDATTKSGRIITGHYTNAEEPFMLFNGTVTSGNSTLNIGGGQAVFNASTRIQFYTAADTTTLTGTLVAKLDLSGLAIDPSGASTATAFLDLAASTTSSASLIIQSGVAPSTPTQGEIHSTGTDIFYYDGTTQKSMIASGGGSPGGSDTEVQFNDSSAFGGDAGLTYNKTTDFLTIAGGLVNPIWRPASDSTTALKMENAAGTTDVITIDTTNSRVGINTSTFVGDTDAGSLDFVSRELIAGATSSGDAADDTSKTAYFTCRHYSNEEQAMMGFIATCSSDTSGTISYGGGSSVYNCATNLVFYTAANTTTTSGTERMRINQNGRVGIGVVPSGSRNLQVSGDAYIDGELSVGHSATATAELDVEASSTTRASLRIRSGTAPTSPNDGDVWFDGSDLHVRISGTTYTLDKTSV